MALFLLLILLVIEIGFMIYGFTLKAPKQNSKKNWSMKRIIVNGAQVAVYMILLLLPGIDFSFRFKGLAIILLLRVLLAGVGFLINRHNEKEKKMAFPVQAFPKESGTHVRIWGSQKMTALFIFDTYP